MQTRSGRRTADPAKAVAGKAVAGTRTAQNASKRALAVANTADALDAQPAKRTRLAKSEHSAVSDSAGKENSNADTADGEEDKENGARGQLAHAASKHQPKHASAQPVQPAQPSSLPESGGSSDAPSGSTPASSAARPQRQTSLLQEAKAAFLRSAAPGRLVGRTSERSVIHSFIQDHVLDNGGKPGALYVSGCPGTGKTALVDEVCRDLAGEMAKIQDGVVVAKVNCMSIADPKAIFVKLLAVAGHMGVAAKDALKVFEGLIVPSASKRKQQIMLVVLDEIDQLISKDQEVLYQLFAWAAQPNTRLVLIGIANAIDLTSRFLPRLKTKNCEPQLLNFNPYTVPEISDIIKARLLHVQSGKTEPPVPAGDTPANQDTPNATAHVQPAVEPIMHPRAIEFAARKIADTGDLRKALDVCRRAFEIAEGEEKQQSAKASAAAHIGDTTAHTVTMRHVISASSILKVAEASARIKALNMQLKFALCTLVVMKRVSCSDFRVGKAFEVYGALSRYRNRSAPVQRSEFKDLISALETQGLIHLSAGTGAIKSGGTGLSKHDPINLNITLVVPPEDVEQTVMDVPLLASVFEQAEQAIKDVHIPGKATALPNLQAPK
ncbi:P-loop containing nucleoside triphosphate hydrolase protein [Entophlyctis helioformis]|nr:P-loop containing nucleoside triphosphate hydrolase protein [Entophlyctis helioformis]